MRKNAYVKAGFTVTVAIILCVLSTLCGCNAHTHTFSDGWTNNASNHWHAATCEHADEKADDAAHTYGKWEVKNSATETEEGLKERICTVCGYKDKAVIAKLDHTHEYTDGNWSYDENDHWIKCNSCDERSQIKAHDWDEGKVTKAPTETEEGEKTYTCSVCSDTKISKIGTLEHTHKYKTTYTYNETYHWYASDCGHEEEISGKAAHDWDEGKVTKLAGCTTKGTTTYTCKICAAEKNEDIDATGHTYSEKWTSNETEHWHAATCEHSTEVSGKTVHTEDNGTVTTVPGITTKGVKTYKCSVCSAILRTEDIDALGLCETVIDAATFGKATEASIYVYFGTFPKTVKSSTVIIDEDETKTMGPATYYKGSDGEWYAKICASLYNSSYTYSDGSKASNTDTYFKVEPIRWKVLTTDFKGTKKALLFADSILTGNVIYSGSTETRTLSEKLIFRNNYKYSLIRAYLNGKYESDDTVTTTYKDAGFLQSAFTTGAQTLIADTAVDNSEGNGGDNTVDKIFLLSLSEVTNESYGFKEAGKWYGERIRKPTDYALANYVYQKSDSKSGDWWLRTPSNEGAYHLYVRKVDSLGPVYDENWGTDYTTVIDTTGLGVVPALTISLE